jgi:hypothetical protein
MHGRAWVTGTDKVWASYVKIASVGGGWIVEKHLKLDWFYYPELSYKDNVDSLPSFTFSECVDKVSKIVVEDMLLVRIRNIDTDEIVSGAIIIHD